MTESQREQRRYALAISGGVCEVCGRPLRDGQPQGAHRIGNTQANRAKYGDFVIDHRFNIGMTCSLKCNGALDISRDIGAVIRLCARIYAAESQKYEGDKMKKAYFQYYETFENILEKIKDIEEREHMRKTIINYGLHGTLPAGLSELEEMAWTICKDLIDQQQHRREVNAANRTGKKSVPATTEENTAVVQPVEKPAQEIQQEKPKRKNFVKPTVEEIAAYCKEKNYNVNAQQFFNYYESNGWKIGRNAMKSWQAAVQNWNTREKANNKAAGTMWENNSTDADTASYEDLF